jgi:hypothetical protein
VKFKFSRGCSKEIVGDGLFHLEKRGADRALKNNLILSKMVRLKPRNIIGRKITIVYWEARTTDKHKIVWNSQPILRWWCPFSLPSSEPPLVLPGLAGKVAVKGRRSNSLLLPFP